MTDENYEYEERAAILEYDAGLSRDEAERIAREMMKGYQAELWQTETKSNGTR